MPTGRTAQPPETIFTLDGLNDAERREEVPVGGKAFVQGDFTFPKKSYGSFAYEIKPTGKLD
jgi:hypothetical protein